MWRRLKYEFACVLTHSRFVFSALLGSSPKSEQAPGGSLGEVPFPRAVRPWQQRLPRPFSAGPLPHRAPPRPSSPGSPWWSSWSERCPLWWCTGQYQPLQQTQNPSCIFHGFHSLMLKANTMGEIRSEVVKPEDGWIAPIVPSRTIMPLRKVQLYLQKTRQLSRYLLLSASTDSAFYDLYTGVPKWFQGLSLEATRMVSSILRLHGEDVCRGGCECQAGRLSCHHARYPRQLANSTTKSIFSRPLI